MPGSPNRSIFLQRIIRISIKRFPFTVNATSTFHAITGFIIIISTIIIIIVNRIVIFITGYIVGTIVLEIKNRFHQTGIGFSYFLHFFAEYLAVLVLLL